LGRDKYADDQDSDVYVDAGTDDECMGDGGSKETGGGAPDVEAEDEDSDELESYDFASSSEKSDAAEEVAAARADRSTGRALSKLQFWRR
jgi:hypothetical protein